MQMISVKSKSIASIGYENEGEQMQVNFRNGEILVFQGIPVQLFNNFMIARQKGKFYGIYIRGKYPSIKIR